MENASTKALLGSGCQEQYCVSCVVSLDANKSMLSSGNFVRISVNTLLFNIHSCLSEKERDLKSASTFNFPAMCTAETQIFRWIHHSHNSVARVFSTGDLDPPMLLIYDTAVVLSIWIWTWVSLAWLQNDCSAKNAALSSKMFMWSIASLVFHLPPIRWSPYTAPHPLFEASVCSWMFALRGWIFLQANGMFEIHQSSSIIDREDSFIWAL